jgi:hypothetical protein
MLQSFTAAIQPMTTALTGPNSGLLGQAIDAPRASVAASTTLSANTLVELPSPSRHMLPVRLSQTLAESGLFYESHLAKWIRGALSLERIQREPQARLAQDAQVAARLAELGGMPEEAARMAGRQLQMLEGAPFWWQGQAWPGQLMDWQVREGLDGDARDDTGDGAAEWITELNLTLPRLGSVHAHLDQGLFQFQPDRGAFQRFAFQHEYVFGAAAQRIDPRGDHAGAAGDAGPARLAPAGRGGRRR